MRRTSLSIGILITAFLRKSDELKKLTTGFYPVYAPKGAKLPLLVFNQDQAEGEAVKSVGGSDRLTLTVGCCSRTYEEAVRMAEAVRDALEGRGKAITVDGQALLANAIRFTAGRTFYDETLAAYVLEVAFDCSVWGSSQG